MLKRLLKVLSIVIVSPVYIALVFVLMTFGIISTIFMPVVYIITGDEMKAFTPFVWLLERLLDFDNRLSKWIYRNYTFIKK